MSRYSNGDAIIHHIRSAANLIREEIFKLENSGKTPVSNPEIFGDYYSALNLLMDAEDRV